MRAHTAAAETFLLLPLLAQLLFDGQSPRLLCFFGVVASFSASSQLARWWRGVCHGLCLHGRRYEARVLPDYARELTDPAARGPAGG